MSKIRPTGDVVVSRPLEVTPRQGENPERMIRRFMKKVRNDGIMQELYDRRGFDKPSVKRRRKKLRAMFNKTVADKASKEN